ncbi:MAG: hypothetical protein R2874_09815 [Desulfobacterales bacterium]
MAVVAETGATFDAETVYPYDSRRTRSLQQWIENRNHLVLKPIPRIFRPVTPSHGYGAGSFGHFKNRSTASPMRCGKLFFPWLPLKRRF